LNTTLSSALNFDQHDLTANRDGRLTARQRNQVYVWQRPLVLALTIITVVIGVISAIAIIAVLLGVEITETGVLLALGGEIITVGLAFLIWSLRQRFKAMLQQPRVHTIRGPVTIYVLRERQVETMARSQTARPGFYIQIEALEFEVGDEVIGAFEDGAAYTLYYVPKPLRLLSAEKSGSEN
jgi:hypothetical protein